MENQQYQNQPLVNQPQGYNPNQPPQQPYGGQPQYGGQQYPPQYQQQPPQQMAMSVMGLDALDRCPSLWIKQKLELFEVMTGIETPNLYKVYPGDQNGKRQTYNQDGTKAKALFKCKEKSDCCMRICCKGQCRGFQMQVKHYQKGKFGDDFKNMFMQCEREFKCFFFCFNRPVMEVKINYPQDQAQGKEPAVSIGSIEWPYMCCEIGLDIRDKNGSIVYKIRGDRCQCGIMCHGWPCKQCQEVFMTIYDANGQKTTPLTKWSPGCFKAAISDSDNFSVVFPQGATKENKALLFASVLMLDYCYFETNNQNKNQSHI